MNLDKLIDVGEFSFQGVVYKVRKFEHDSNNSFYIWVADELWMIMTPNEYVKWTAEIISKLTQR